tara:strand:+ start:561 stop:800 length:240 start_codon:yes stop_codon:yes gene_type:complete
METKYCIINSDDVYLIDFDQVLQSSHSTLRYSPDKEKVVIKYFGDQPDFVFKITEDDIGLPEYTQSEILSILSSEEWRA